MDHANKLDTIWRALEQCPQGTSVADLCESCQMTYEDVRCILRELVGRGKIEHVITVRYQYYALPLCERIMTALTQAARPISSDALARRLRCTTKRERERLCATINMMGVLSVIDTKTGKLCYYVR